MAPLKEGRTSGPPFRLPPVQATALAHPALKATANAAPLRFGLERGSRRPRFRRRAAAHLAGRKGTRRFRFTAQRSRTLVRSRVACSCGASPDFMSSSMLSPSRTTVFASG